MISVCLASHNGEKYIANQIMSILSQLDYADELIISDDGSTDKTLDIVLSFKDSRIKLISSTITGNKHRYASSFYNVTHNFESALIKSTGDYIFLSDQDDIWMPNKVAEMVKLLSCNSLVMTNWSYINKDGTLYQNKVLNDNPINASFIKNLIHLPFKGCCMAFTREILCLALPFPKNIVTHDGWIGLIASYFHKPIAYCNIPLILYRRHSSNVSNLDKSRNPLHYKILYRLIFIFCLIKRKWDITHLQKCCTSA